MRLSLALAVLVMLTVGGCAKMPGDDPGPKHRWFNPYGQEVEDNVPDRCAPEGPPPADVPPKVPGDAVPAGWHHAVYTLMVDGMKATNVDVNSIVPPTFDVEYCIPVSLYVYATAANMPATLVEVDDDGVLSRVTPWNALRNTPWRSTIVVAWDPNTTAPVMNFELSARYEVGPGLMHAPNPVDAKVGMMCRIRQANATISYGVSMDVFAPARTVDSFGDLAEYVTGPFVRCRPPAFQARAM